MKRIVMSVVAMAALAMGGLFASTAEAHGPYGNRCQPGFGVGVYSGYSGYAGYGGYGYAPYVAYPRYVPYGAGYSGGWQPYQGFYRTGPRPQVGLYFGF